MNFTTSKEANVNYLAKIVKINSFKPHPNADKLKLTTVDGYVVSTSIDSSEGIYVYFPVECTINKEFLKINNLYRDCKLNIDSSKSGFFEESGRVKCIKLRGLASEGLIMPIDTIYKFLKESICIKELEKLVGIEFDSINNLLLVKKYVIPTKITESSNKPLNNKKVINIVDNQFRYHIDTEHLQRNISKIQPTDIINISWKEHGTSAIFCNLLVNRSFSWKEKLSKFFGVNIVESEYKKFCSSRKVIKDKVLNSNVTSGYYDSDIWSIALEVIKDFLHEGLSIYAEIVGYMPNGSMIQSEYDYKCIYNPKLYEYSKMIPQQMYDAKLFDIIVYRITYTNVEGKVFEFSTQQIKDFCNKYNIHCIKELYYGPAQYLFPNLNIDEHWHENFLQLLRDTYLEKRSILCNNNVPEEGIVLRKESSNIEVYKLKSINFLEKESKMLDKGVVDIETI